MTINEFVNNPYMNFNAALKINVYNDENGDLTTVVNTLADGWGDVPYDLCDKEVTAISTENGAIVLEVCA